MTVREIAELAGVSIGTVDRVLYKRGRVSEATRAKIERIIERYQWTTNPLARSLKRAKPYTFCTVLPRRNQDAGYWACIIEGIKDGEAVVSPLGIQTTILEYDRYNRSSFNEAARQIIDSKPDGLIIPPIMPEMTLPFIARAEEAGIPYVFVDADMPGLSPRCAIAQNPYSGGCLAGRLMHLFISTSEAESGVRRGAAVAVLDAHGEDYHIRKRRDGFVAYAAEHGMTVVVEEYSGYRGTELPKTRVEHFLRVNAGLAGIFVTNAMAHRVVEVVQALRAKSSCIADDLCIIGYDLVPANRARLQQNMVAAIICQRPEEQGKQAVLSLYRAVVLEQRISEKIEIPINVYLKENIPPENSFRQPF
ncbi:MAG: LacI family transcriptional regulator [Spirochaetaceae bacterium]|jgi:LacI family transcriptional regulator|nr:LacI family transcriptional regulator [Spirochaetaceae bacterium]